MMHMHRCNKLFLFIALFFVTDFVFSSDWVLAAVKFDAEIIDSSSKTEKTAYSAILESLQNELPKLIMSYITKGVERQISNDEYYQRELQKLQIEQQKNFEAYRKNITERDKVVIVNTDAKDIKNKISTANEAIEKSVEKINTNIQAQKDLLENIYTKKTIEINNEKVSVYKDDVNELYGKNVLTIVEKQSLTENEIIQKNKEYEKNIIKDNINGLVSGIISLYDNYIQITTTFTVFPSTIQNLVVTEVGDFTDIDYLAKSIANTLINGIILSKPVNIHFTIETASEEFEPHLFIDKVIYRGNDIQVRLPKSNYSIRIEADSYQTVSFNYNFNRDVNYNINVKMKEVEITPLFLAVVPEKKGELFLNGIPQGESPATILVNDEYFMGQFVSEDKVNTFFMLDIANLSNVNIPVLNQSTASIIDFSRKRLYFSYGLLLGVLPFYFYSQGEFDIAEQAYNLQFVSEAEYNKKSLISNIATVAVGVTAVNMVVQLVRYLLDAEVVYPNTIDSKTDIGKISKKSFYQKDAKKENTFTDWIDNLFKKKDSAPSEKQEEVIETEKEQQVVEEQNEQVIEQVEQE